MTAGTIGVISIILAPVVFVSEGAHSGPVSWAVPGWYYVAVGNEYPRRET